MNRKSLKITLVVCILLAMVLPGLAACAPAESEVSDPVIETTGLNERPEASTLNPNAASGDEYYCTLVIDTWSAENGVLEVSTFAQAVLPDDMETVAQLELWKNHTVLDSKPVTFELGEGEGILEADVSASFDIPDMAADEELQLWLTVTLGEIDVVYCRAGGWYLEDGQLMLITG